MNPESLRNSYARRALVVCAVLIELLLLAQVQPASAKTDAVMIVGPIAGGVTNKTATIWFRADQAANVAVSYSTSADLTNALTTASQKTVGKNKFAALVSLVGLKPNTTYYYQVLVNSVSQNTAPFPHFSTFATRGTPTNFSFGILTDFGSNGTL